MPEAGNTNNSQDQLNLTIDAFRQAFRPILPFSVDPSTLATLASVRMDSPDDEPVVYLAGPILGCTDEECRAWREDVARRIRGRCLNPMRRDYRGREDDYITELVEADKADIDESDIVLVNYTRPSTGTSMEIMCAWWAEKTVIVVVPPDEPVSPWIHYHATMVVDSMDEAIRRINAFNGEEVPNEAFVWAYEGAGIDYQALPTTREKISLATGKIMRDLSDRQGFDLFAIDAPLQDAIFSEIRDTIQEAIAAIGSSS